MPHTPNTQVALWGAELAGRACPINPMLQPDHIVGLLRAADARVAVVLGRQIELLTGDGQSKPDFASAIVREWFDNQDVQMVTGLSNSAIGLAVQAMARDKNRIITGSEATEITGAQCSPNGLHWVFDTYAINHEVPAPLLNEGAKSWFLLVADITLGKALVRDILPVLEQGGAEVVGQVFHPLFTTDMSSPVFRAQSSRPPRASISRRRFIGIRTTRHGHGGHRPGQGHSVLP